jgi:hypothetical protein
MEMHEGIAYFVVYAYSAALELAITHPWTAVVLAALVYAGMFSFFHYRHSFSQRTRPWMAAPTAAVFLGLAPLFVMLAVVVGMLIKGRLH